MEAKVKEEVPDKDYNLAASVERRKPPSNSKERRSPEQEESRSSTPPTAPAPPSPQNNGTNESSSPPLNEARGALQRLKRFLSALQQFAADVSSDAGERVRHHIYSLVSGSTSIEEFQSCVQECTNYPLRASVPGFLRALLPHAQRDLTARARAAKMTPLQYIRTHEHLILEPGGDSADIFSSQTSTAIEPAKRRASDPFYDTAIPQTNGTHHGVVDPIDYAPPPKRPPPTGLFLHPSPFLYPLPTNSSLFEYGHYHPAYHGTQGEHNFERRDGGISVRDVSSMNASFSESRGLSSNPAGNLGSFKNDDEWKNINTMLNCILSMVEKTKRALAILQQRGTEPGESNDIKRAANEIMAAAVRQTEERVAEVRRRAEDAVNQVKRQALVDLQRAVGAAEAKALELVAAERSKVERLLLERRHTPPGSPSPGPAAAVATAPPPPPPPPVPVAQQNCCWNCGRKAQETCSGCNAARYCGAFCQHKDWEHHHQVCSGRDQKPGSVLTTSPPVTQTTTLSKTTRATTPITGTSENRLSLTSLNNAERMLSSNQERNIATGNTERIALATLSTAQSLMGSLGGKK